MKGTFAEVTRKNSNGPGGGTARRSFAAARSFFGRRRPRRLSRALLDRFAFLLKLLQPFKQAAQLFQHVFEIADKGSNLFMTPPILSNGVNICQIPEVQSEISYRLNA